MQAYATTERLVSDTQLHGPLPSATSAKPAEVPALFQGVAIEQLLGRLADLIVDRLTTVNQVGGGEALSEWLDARAAADYLGMHRDTLRKLAAERSIPTHQDGPGCKLYFRRDELDVWRVSADRPTRPSSWRLRAV